MLSEKMVLSIIHGGYYDPDLALKHFEKDKFERLFVLGDLSSYSFDETDDMILEQLPL